MERSQLQQAIAPYMDKGFLRVDVHAIRRVLLRRPWVKQVALRRVFPDTIAVYIAERQPQLRFNKSGLIDSTGCLFYPKNAKKFSNLPQLFADKHFFDKIYKQYRAIAGTLGTLRLQVAALSFDARLGYRLRLTTGLHVILGQRTNTQKLRHFVAVYRRHIAGKAITYVDLRYENAMALGTGPVTLPQQVG